MYSRVNQHVSERLVRDGLCHRLCHQRDVMHTDTLNYQGNNIDITANNC